MAAFAGKLRVTIGANTSELEKKLKDVNKRIKSLGKSLTSFGKDFSLLTTPIMALGTAAFGVGLKVQNAFRTIKIGTGATGAALKGLQDDFKAIAVLGPQSFDDSAKAIADLNTMTGASGKVLQELSMAVLGASRMMGTDLGGTIASLGKLLNNWNLGAEQGVAVLDKLFVASQATGMGMDAIAQGVTASGGALRTLGLGLDESIALISTLDKAGVDSQQAMRSLSRALVALAKEGVTDTSQALTAIIEQIKGAQTMSEALDIGKNMFGVRAGADLAIAIREGKIELTELIAALQTAGGTIADTSRETMTLGERWSTLGNQAAMALEPLGTRLVQLAEEYMPNVTGVLSDFSLELSDTTIVIGAFVAAAGPLLIVLGSVVSNAAAVLSAIKGVAIALSGPVGLTIALVAAVAGLGTYITESDKARIASEDLKEAQEWLNGKFQEASTEHMQSELAHLRGELIKLEAQAVDTWTMVARATAFGERGVSAIVTEQEAAAARQAEKLRAKISALETEIQNRTAQEAAATVTEAPSTGDKIERRTRLGGRGVGGKKGGGGGRSGPSALDTFIQDVQDRIKYFQEDGNAYMDKVDAMQAKTKPLTDDWKKLQDLRLSIDDSAFSAKLQKIQDEIKYLEKDSAAFVPELQKMLEGLDPLSEKWKRVQDVITNITESGYSERWSGLAWEFSEGLLSAADYARMLEVEIAGLTEGTDKWRARFSELQNIKTSEISKLLDFLSRQFESGKLSNVEYEAALAGIVSQFKEFPRAAKIAAEALDAFQKQSELTTVSVGQQLQAALKQTTKDFNEMWGKGIEGAIDGFLEASIRGADFGDSLRKLGEDIVFTTLKMLILKQIMGMFGLGGGGASVGAALDLGAWNAGFSFPIFAKGGAFSHGNLTPFSKGGVVHRPTVFPMATGAGLMGEAGPEAVMPLGRDSHGRLGVVASGGITEPPSVTVNVINESSQPVTATQTGPTFDEQMRQMVVGVILRDQATNGPITQNFRRR